MGAWYVLLYGNKDGIKKNIPIEYETKMWMNFYFKNKIETLKLTPTIPFYHPYNK